MSSHSQNWNAWVGNPAELFVDGVHQERAAPRNVGPWHVTVAECGECRLARSRDGSYHEYMPVHGWSYVGSFRNDTEAVAVWRGRLRSRGLTT